MRTESGAKLYDISMPNEPRELHTYGEPAWYEGVWLSGGNLVAKHDRRRASSSCMRQP